MAYDRRLTNSPLYFLPRVNGTALIEFTQDAHGLIWGFQYAPDMPADEATTAQPPAFRQGRPALLTPRWRQLMLKNPHFLQGHRVPGGYCTLALGPDHCAEFLECTEAGDGGCTWFATDPADEGLRQELAERALEHRQQQHQHEAAGRMVAASKSQVQAGRTEDIYQDTVRHASQEHRQILTALVQHYEDEHA